MMAYVRRAGLLLVVLAVLAAGCGQDAAEGDAANEPEETNQPPDGEWEPEYVDGVLQPLPDGFPDSELTLLVIDEAASDDGIYARHLQQVATGMSPVPINVLDRPDFGTYGTWEALGFMQNDHPGGTEGYIAGVFTVPGNTLDLISTPVIEDLGVEADDLNFVLGTESVPYVIVSRTDAPWGDSFRDLLDYALEHPGEVRYISRGPGAGPDIAMQHYLLEAGGVELDTSVGGGHPEILAALGAGAGDVAVTLPGQVGPFLEDGSVVVLACTQNTDPCAGFDDASPANSVIDSLDSDSWGSNRGLFVTPETPESHRLWLETLTRDVLETEEFVDLRAQIPGSTMNALSHEELDTIQADGLDAGRPILEQAGLLQPGT